MSDYLAQWPSQACSDEIKRIEDARRRLKAARGDRAATIESSTEIRIEHYLDSWHLGYGTPKPPPTKRIVSGTLVFRSNRVVFHCLGKLIQLLSKSLEREA